MRDFVIRGLLILLLAGLTIPDAVASQGDCVEWSLRPPNVTFGTQEYRINSVSFYDHMPTVTTNEAELAIAMSANVWNEQAEAGPFLNAGVVGLTALPDQYEDCLDLGIDFHLVRASTWCGSAYVDAMCVDLNGNSHALDLVIRRQLSDCSADWNYQVGDISAGDNDLIQVFVHEFGHILGLSHPENGEAASIFPTSAGTNRSRDLYYYDRKCSRELSGTRRMSPMYRTFSGGVLGPETWFTDPLKATQTSVGYSLITTPPPCTFCLNFWQKWSVENTDTCMATTNSLSSGLSCILNGYYGMSPRAGLWLEEPGRQRVFYASEFESPVYQPTAKHRFSQIRSDDGFADNKVWASMSHCTSMNGWMSCSNIAGAYTGRAPSIAWDNFNDRSVTTWVNQNRLNNTQSRQIKIATGHSSDWLLPQPDDLGVQTSVTPGVACNAFSAGGYDCIVAYVDQSDTSRQIRVKRFWSTKGTNRYFLVREPGYQSVPFWTVSSIAAWYDSAADKFYIGVKSPGIGESLYVLSSDNGVTWSFANILFESGTVISPNVASYWTGFNYLSYMKL